MNFISRFLFKYLVISKNEQSHAIPLRKKIPLFTSTPHACHLTRPMGLPKSSNSHTVCSFTPVDFPNVILCGLVCVTVIRIESFFHLTRISCLTYYVTVSPLTFHPDELLKYKVCKYHYSEPSIKYYLSHSNQKYIYEAKRF